LFSLSPSLADCFFDGLLLNLLPFCSASSFIGKELDLVGFAERGIPSWVFVRVARHWFKILFFVLQFCDVGLGCGGQNN